MEMSSWSLDDVSPAGLDFEPYRFPEYLSPLGHDLPPHQQQHFNFSFKTSPVNNSNNSNSCTQNNLDYTPVVKQEELTECHQANNGNCSYSATNLQNNQILPTKQEPPMNYSAAIYNGLSYGMKERGHDKESPNFELYHDLIMQHLVKDIQVTCRRLGIPPDPRSWSVENTQRWLINVANQYHLAHVPFEKLGLPGMSICSMGLDALKQALPVGGELMHAQLNVWITANDYTQRYQAHYNELMNQTGAGASYHYSSTPTQHSKISTTNEKIKNRCAPVCVPVDGQSTIVPLDLLTPTTSDSGVSADMDDLSASDPDTPSAKDDLHKTFFKTNIHLWQFLRELLDNQTKYARCVRWLKREEGVFKIEDSHQLAKLWGERKHRPAMNYDKLSRSLRQYYKKGILKKTSRSQRLVYQFLAPFC